MNKEIESHGFYCFMGVVFKMSVWEKQRCLHGGDRQYECT